MENFDNAEEIGGFEEIFGETETKIVDLPDFDFDKFRKESLKNVLIKVQFFRLFSSSFEFILFRTHVEKNRFSLELIFDFRRKATLF